jgi:HEAT repeat protein
MEEPMKVQPQRTAATFHLLPLVVAAGIMAGCAIKESAADNPTAQFETAVALVETATAESASGGFPTPTAASAATPLVAPPTPELLPTPVPLPPPVLLADWDNLTVRRLCLDANVSYPSIEQPDFSLPIIETVERILARMEIQTVSPGESCDATLWIDLDAEADSAHYRPAGLCYTGARISGDLTLSTSSGASYEKPIWHVITPPYTASSCPKEPHKAPFYEVWPGVVVDMLGSIWGPPAFRAAIDEENSAVSISAIRKAGYQGRWEGLEPEEAVALLVYALADERVEVRQAAMSELGQLGAEAAPAVPYLLDVLRNDVEEARSDAARALGYIGPEEGTIDGLINALKFDQSVDVRTEAAGALGRLGPAAAEAVPALLDALKTASPDVQVDVIGALGGIGPEASEAVPVLHELLLGDDLDLRAAAATALGGIGPAARETVPDLIAALDDESARTQQAAARALGGIGPDAEAAVPYLLEMWADTQLYSTTRQAVAEGLGGIGPASREAIPSLIEALHGEDEALARSAAKALGGIGPETEEVIPALLYAVSQDGAVAHSVRLAAVEALGRIGPVSSEILPALMQLLEHSDPQIRIAAAKALGDIGPDAIEAVPGLLELLREGKINWGGLQFHQEKSAAEALTAITGQDFGEDVDAWQAWWDAQPAP